MSKDMLVLSGEQVRSTEEINPTGEAIDFCDAMGVDPNQVITKFTMEDYAVVLLQYVEAGMPKQQAEALLEGADIGWLNDRLLDASGWHEILWTCVDIARGELT